MTRTESRIAVVEATWEAAGRFFARVASFAMLFLCALVVVDVVMRYLFNHPIPGGTEGTELILPYIVFLALGHTLAVGGHVRVTILYGRLPARLRSSVEGLDALIGMFFFGVLTWYSWCHFWESLIILEDMMAPIRLPWWVGKFSMPLGFFAMFMQFLINFLQRFAKK